MVMEHLRGRNFLQQLADLPEYSESLAASVFEQVRGI